MLNENKLQEYQRMHNGELPSQMSANLQGLHNAEMALQSLGEVAQPRSRAAPVLRAQVADIVEAPDADAGAVARGADARHGADRSRTSC